MKIELESVGFAITELVETSRPGDFEMAAIQKLDYSKRKFEETVRTIDGENTPLITEVLPPEMLKGSSVIWRQGT